MMHKPFPQRPYEGHLREEVEIQMSFNRWNFSIAQRIGAGFFLVVGIMAAVTWIGLNALDEARQDLELVVTRDAYNVREAARMVQDIIALQRAEKNLILAQTQHEMDEYEDAIAQIASRLRQRLHALSESVDEEGTTILNEFRSHFENYSQSQKEIIALTRKNSNVQARNLSQGEGQALYEKLSRLLESMVEKSETVATYEAQKMADAAFLKAKHGNLLYDALLDTLKNEKSMLFEDAPEDIPSRMELIEKGRREVQDGIVVLESLVKGSEEELLSGFKKKWLQYVATSEETIRLVQEGSKQQARSLYRKTGRTRHEIALRSLRQFMQKTDLELESSRKRMEAAIKKSRFGNQINRNIGKIHQTQKDLILTLSQKEMKRYATRISLLQNTVRRQLDRLNTLASSAETVVLGQVQNFFEIFSQVNQKVVDKSMENANHRAFDLSSGKARQSLDSAEQTLRQLVEKNDRDMQIAMERADRDYVNAQRIGIGSAIFAILLCVIIAFLIIRFLTSRVAGLVSRAYAISQGESAVFEKSRFSQDELSVIEEALAAISTSYGNIAAMAEQVVIGDFSGRLKLRGKHDQISLAINQIISNMESIIGQAHAISLGRFDVEISPRSDRDRLSHALMKMARSLASADREHKRQTWEQSVLLELGEAMQGKLSITELSNNVVEALCRRLDAVSGLLYLVVELQDEEVLQRTGSIAAPDPEETGITFKIGEGLIGQAVMQREPVLVEDIADAFAPIASGLGNLRPDALVLAPFYYEGERRGVVELAFLHAPEEHRVRFIGKVVETIAMVFETAQARPLAEALNESRQLTRQLQETNQQLIRKSSDLEKARQVLEERNTTLQEAQKELTAQAEQLKRSDQYKSDFLATMSHEIRTPMNGILGTAQLLERTDLDPQQKKFVDTIVKSGLGLLSIIDDILDLSKIEAGRLALESQDFELRAIIDNVANLVSSRVAEKKLQFHVDLSPDIPAVLKGDPTRLRQVLLNLVGNAVKFTESGSVSFHGSLEDSEGGRRWVRLEVQDTGIGIPPDIRDQLFQPFSQGDPSVTRRYGGTGLGLIISKRLVNAMGGDIGVENRPDEGSSFWVRLPMEEGSINEVPQMAVTIRPLATPLSVLLVEDEETNQEVALGMLERMGCIATLVEGGQEALDAVSRHPFDLVFMDVQMPGMDGWEATRRIRNLSDPHKAALPIMAMTAYAMKADANRCYEAGMDGFITKPLLFEKLSEILHSIEEGRASRPAARTADEMGNPPAGSRILDTGKLKKLQSDLSSDRFTKVVNACLTSIDQSSRSFQEAFEQQDSGKMARQAHKLKGTAGSCGLDKLHGCALEVEKLARNAGIEENSPLPKELMALVGQSQDALNGWMVSSGVPVRSGHGHPK